MDSAEVPGRSEARGAPRAPFPRAIVAPVAWLLLVVWAGPAAAQSAPSGEAPSEGGAAAGPCVAALAAPAQAYARPSLLAAPFGARLPAGERVPLVGRDRDGWWAFAPGVAQAANVGPFRLRWYPPDTPLRVPDTAACRALAVVAGPPAGVCAQMAMESEPLRVAPGEDATVLTTLRPGDWLAVRAAQGDWLELDTGVGTVTPKGLGYLPRELANVNGPCDAVFGAPR